MKRAFVLSLATMLAGTVAAAAAYEWNKPSSDPLDDTLREYHFRRINPPSNLLTVGTLYYVDPAGKSYTLICQAERSDLDGHVITSATWELQEKLERNGRFNTGVTVDLSAVLRGDIDNNYIQTVHASLTHVVLEEIPLAPNRRIFTKLMEDPDCSKIATELADAGGYVCQGQKTLQATAEYKLGRDVQSRLEVGGKLTPEELKHIVKQAIETQAHESVVIREDRLFGGSELKYGILMNPTCLLPKTGRFERILPNTTFDRVMNFIKFHIVERLFPAPVDPSQVAQQSEVSTVAVAGL
jgi:hypothetical protein